MKDLNEFLDSFNIQDSRRYTMREVAAMLNVLPSTVKQWRTIGLRNSAHGVFFLETFFVANSPMILGAHLKRFLIQRNEKSS